MKKISLSILFVSIGLISSIARADPYSNQTNEVFHELGWFRQKPNEQIISQQGKPDFNFYEATGFRIFMSESAATVYDFISCQTASGDLVEIFLDKIEQTRSNKYELSFTYTDSNYMELTQVSGNQTLIEQTEKVLKSVKGATYKKKVGGPLGGSFESEAGKNFKDQDYLLDILGKVCKSGLQQVK